ncbi:unnamed protein product [Calicophoron daubneyi]|uniref:Assembly chaperone of rpl4 n=1 Tax=Calicophoron daubneyi TaxID=300641 RepID=A0AAV2SW77_CALDB
MGKPKTFHGKKARSSGATIQQNAPHSDSSQSTPNMSVEELLKQATDFENQFEPDKALRSYNLVIRKLGKSTTESQQTLSKETQDTADSQLIKALQSSGYILVELGRNQEAKKRFMRVLSLTPSPAYETYMYLGQLTEGKESLEFYQKGLEAIRKTPLETVQIASTISSPAQSPPSLSRAESNAFCAIAELYMTDLCDLPEAQSKCKEAFDGATQTDPTNPQAWLTAANFYTVIADAAAARDSINRCLDLWWTKLEAALIDPEEEKQSEVGETEKLTLEKMETSPSGEESGAKTGKNEDDELDLEEITGIPTTGLISLARMMAELEMNEVSMKCATILEALLEEDEDNPEVHYLLTVIGRKLWKDENPDLLRYYATTTKVIAAKMGDTELVDEMTELIADLPPPTRSQSENSINVSSSSEEDQAVGSKD